MRLGMVRLVATLTLVLFGALFTAHAQRLTTAHRIGWLSSGSPPAGPNPSVEAFRSYCQELCTQGSRGILLYS